MSISKINEEARLERILAEHPCGAGPVGMIDTHQGEVESLPVLRGRLAVVVATTVLFASACSSQMDILREADPSKAMEIAAMCAGLRYPANVGAVQFSSRSDCEESFASTANFLREMDEKYGG